MSRICIGVIYDFKEKSEVIKERIKECIGQYNLGVFFDTCAQPFFNELPQFSILFSIADDMLYDNCEMLLLPDGWMINYTPAKESFRDRAKYIADIMATARDVSLGKIELFIGDDGSYSDDFTVVNTSADSFWNDMCNLRQYDEKMFPENFHFVFSD